MHRILDNVVVRLGVYYVVVLGLFLSLLELFPSIGAALLEERARSVGVTWPEGAGDPSVSGPNVAVNQLEALVPIVFTLLGALALSLPVAFVYQWTREPKTYRRDFSRALVALPIAVALAVFLVKSSLALAFSLAGIVAAIRWRAALNETMDGVFTFVVIGIGLAAGSQLLLVAFVASLLFNALILGLARTGHGSRPRQLHGFVLTAPLELTPARTPRSVGIRVDVADRERAEAHIETVLDASAKDWQRTAAAPLADGRTLLEYAATLRRRCTVEQLRASLADAGVPEIGDVAITSEPAARRLEPPADPDSRGVA